MTKDELKNLPHLRIVEENTTTLHIHCEDGYILYNVSTFENIDENNEPYTDYEMSGSCCYFFPIYDEYPKYVITTDEEYEMKKEGFENLNVEGKKMVYEEFIK